MARDNDITDIFLLPGEYFVGGAGHRIRTLLGSCVSITLWHPERKIGTMSHFLLSSRNPDKSSELNSRYGEESLELMLSKLRAMGVDPTECQAKIFGGGQMFPGAAVKACTSIGRQNGEVALRLLRAHGIPVVSESLYGVGHRSIIFDISSGNVWSRHMAPESPARRASCGHDIAHFFADIDHQRREVVACIEIAVDAAQATGPHQFRTAKTPVIRHA